MIDEEIIRIVWTIHPDRGKKAARIPGRAFNPNAFPLTMHEAWRNDGRASQRMVS
jgi:hypothetical protein